MVLLILRWGPLGKLSAWLSSVRVILASIWIVWKLFVLAALDFLILCLSCCLCIWHSLAPWTMIYVFRVALIIACMQTLFAPRFMKSSWFCLYTIAVKFNLMGRFWLILVFLRLVWKRQLIRLRLVFSILLVTFITSLSLNRVVANLVQLYLWALSTTTFFIGQFLTSYFRVSLRVPGWLKMLGLVFGLFAIQRLWQSALYLERLVDDLRRNVFRISMIKICPRLVDTWVLAFRASVVRVDYFLRLFARFGVESIKLTAFFSVRKLVQFYIVQIIFSLVWVGSGQLFGDRCTHMRSLKCRCSFAWEIFILVFWGLDHFFGRASHLLSVGVSYRRQITIQLLQRTQCLLSGDYVALV